MFTRGFEKEEGISDSSDCFCACVGPGARRKGARVFFKVFAPDAVAVWVVGSFNGWRDTHPLSKACFGSWETSIPISEINDGDGYKFKICGRGGEIYVTDPYALENDGPPHFNSVYRDIPDELWHTYENEEHVGYIDSPVNVYELRADKWVGGGTAAHYCDIGREMLPYLLQMGYTHVCLAGILEDYYDHACARDELAYFAPRKEQGGIEGLCELVHSMHSSGVGVLLDWRINRIPDCVDGMEFLVDNAFYWLDLYGIDGFMIGDDGAVREEMSRAIDSLKSRRPEVYFISRDVCGNAQDMGVDETVKDCDALCSRFSAPRDDDECLRMKMAARTYLAFREGKMTTHMGCESGQARWDAKERGIDKRLWDRSTNARLQLFVSDLNSLYRSCECLWRRDRTVRELPCGQDGEIAVVECSYGDERVVLAVDFSGVGGEACLPCCDDLSVLLCTSSQRYTGDGTDALRRGACGTVVTLPAFGAVVLG